MNAAWFFPIALIVPWIVLLVASRRDIARLRRLRADQARSAAEAAANTTSAESGVDPSERKRAASHLAVR